MNYLGRSHIGFKYAEATDISFKTYNPKLGKENELVFYEASEAEVEEAVQLAHQAEIVLRKKSIQERVTLLKTIKSELENEQKSIKISYCAESGLSEKRFEVEWKRILFQLDHLADFLLNNFQEKTNEKTFPGGKTLQKTYVPVGPVVVFGASNFPLAYSTIGGDSVAALAAACPVLVKSHPMHAGTGNLVAECIVRAVRKCDFPAGTFSNLNAKNYRVGTQLVQHEKVKSVAFTGSIAGGVALQKLAEKRPVPIPVFAEMGSLNPVVFSPQKLKNKAAELADDLAVAICGSSGQFCTKPGILFLFDSKETNDFISKLVRSMANQILEPMLHPEIAAKFHARRKEIAQLESVQTIYEKEGERSWDAVHQLCAISAEDFCQHAVCWEEVFGSFSLIVRVKSKLEIAACLAKLGGQLTFSIYAEKKELVEFETLLDWAFSNAGRIIFNGVPTGVEVDALMQHGGVFPASSDSRFSAVGSDSMYRFLRPVSLQRME